MADLTPTRTWFPDGSSFPGQVPFMSWVVNSPGTSADEWISLDFLDPRVQPWVRSVVVTTGGLGVGAAFGLTVLMVIAFICLRYTCCCRKRGPKNERARRVALAMLALFALGSWVGFVAQSYSVFGTYEDINRESQQAITDAESFVCAPGVPAASLASCDAGCSPNSTHGFICQIDSSVNDTLNQIVNLTDSLTVVLVNLNATVDAANETAAGVSQLQADLNGTGAALDNAKAKLGDIDQVLLPACCARREGTVPVCLRILTPALTLTLTLTPALTRTPTLTRARPRGID